MTIQEPLTSAGSLWLAETYSDSSQEKQTHEISSTHQGCSLLKVSAVNYQENTNDKQGELRQNY